MAGSGAAPAATSLCCCRFDCASQCPVNACCCYWTHFPHHCHQHLAPMRTSCWLRCWTVSVSLVLIGSHSLRQTKTRAPRMTAMRSMCCSRIGQQAPPRLSVMHWVTGRTLLRLQAPRLSVPGSTRSADARAGARLLCGQGQPLPSPHAGVHVSCHWGQAFVSAALAAHLGGGEAALT